MLSYIFSELTFILTVHSSTGLSDDHLLCHWNKFTDKRTSFGIRQSTGSDIIESEVINNDFAKSGRSDDAITADIIPIEDGESFRN